MPKIEQRGIKWVVVPNRSPGDYNYSLEPGSKRRDGRDKVEIPKPPVEYGSFDTREEAEAFLEKKKFHSVIRMLKIAQGQ